ncbi:MAG: sigma-70 family RNA polymerase sigma factor [Sedimentisphaerales bacterium]|nr:sigma-70 family RNA polymerase sigma factor [Sedimentisphaerales bacterium]
MLEDKLLIWKIRSGDAAAIARVYEKYKNVLLKIASGLLNRNSIAEDVVHDVFVNLAKSHRSLRPEGNLKIYLAVCVANHARNVNKSGQRLESSNLDDTELLVSDSQGPERWIIQNEELDKLNNALAQLPYSQREIIILHVHSEMKFKDIAKLQDISINTAQSRYRYGFEKLRSLLNGEV